MDPGVTSSVEAAALVSVLSILVLRVAGGSVEMVERLTMVSTYVFVKTLRTVFVMVL